MAQVPLNYGLSVEDGTGDPLRTMFAKIQGNLTDLDTRLATTTALTALLRSAAFQNVGSIAGTVADGGALAAEIARATAAEQANTTLINNEVSRAQSAEALKASLNSPAFTGIPTAPTATAGSGGTQIATLDFVATAVAAGGGSGGGGTGGVPTSRTISAAGLATGGGDLTANRTITVPKAAESDVAAGTDDTKALTSYSIAAALGAKAPLASPTFVGTPTAPTPAPADNGPSIATTAFVATSYAPLASPALTGAPTAPTQAAADNSTKLATTAFVQSSIAPLLLITSGGLADCNQGSPADAVNINFTAKGTTLSARASVAFQKNDGTQNSSDGYARIVIYDTQSGSSVYTGPTQVVSWTAAFNGLVGSGALSAFGAYSNLTIGKTYRLCLQIWKSANAGATPVQYYTLAGDNQ